MCGFCDEVICTFGVVESELKGEPIKPYTNLVYGYVQETQDLTSCIKACLSAEIQLDAGSLLCRTWELMLNTSHHEACYALVSLADIEVVGEVLQMIQKFPDFDVMAQLGDFRIYQDEVRWQRLVADEDALIADAETILRKFCGFWLIDDTKDMVSHNPFEVPSPCEWGKLHEWFPAVFFAYAVLERYQAPNDLFEKIATKHVAVMPRFASPVLWLQRKAYAYCVQQKGASFIIDNFEKCRLELAYYGVLKVKLTKGEYSQIKQYAINHEYESVGVDTGDLVKLIDTF